MPDRLKDLLEAVAAGDERRAEEAALTLHEMGDAATRTLRDLAKDPDPDRRWWALRALAAVGTDTAITLLIRALEDVDPDVRACAVMGLSQLRPEEAIGPMAARLSDPSAYVGRLTADGLAQFGQPAVKALIRVLEEGESAARAGAARALSAIQPEQAIPALYKALDDPSALVTYYAEEALERMGVGIMLFRP